MQHPRLCVSFKDVWPGPTRGFNKLARGPGPFLSASLHASRVRDLRQPPVRTRRATFRIRGSTRRRRGPYGRAAGEAPRHLALVLLQEAVGEREAARVGLASGEEQVAAERFLLIMQPFYDSASPQLEGLLAASSAMNEAQGRMKTYFFEDQKANVDELYSRWASFLGQVETAVANINDDRKKARK